MTKILIAYGYVEDNWTSIRILGEKYLATLDRLSPEGYEFIPCFPSIGRTPKWYDRRLNYRKYFEHCDAIHLMDGAYGDSLLGLTTPSILTIHDMAFWKSANWRNRWFRRRIIQGWKIASFPIASSAQTALDLQSECKINPRKTINPPCDTNLFCFNNSKRTQGRLLHVGSCMPRKGVDRIIRLLAKLPKLYHFIQAGGTPSVDLIKLATNLGVLNRITFTGPQTEQQLVQLYHTAQALVFPSRYEGYGLPVIEARLCGTPVITSHEVPSTGFITGDPGLYIRSFESLDNDSQTSLRADFIPWSTEPIELEKRQLYGYDAYAQKMLAIYDQVTAKHSSRLAT